MKITTALLFSAWLLTSTGANSASVAQASISNINFSVSSLTSDTASYAIKIDPSYPYTTPTTLGATVYDLDYTSPGGYQSTYLNSYSLFDNLSTVATSVYNQASSSSGTGFLISSASSHNQISAAAAAATGTFVGGSNGLEISANSTLLISYDISVYAKDDGLTISSTYHPFESAFAYAKIGFYGNGNWLSSGTQLIGAGTNQDGISDDIEQSGHYSSWITNNSNSSILVGLDVRTYAEAYGGGVAPVPLPSATWLLYSGLLGLIGVARRKAA